MPLLDRYLLKEFSRNLLWIVAVFTAVYLLVDFFEKIDNFIESREPLTLAIKYFLLKIPFIIEQLMPVSILLAGIITLGLLHHHLELIALKAGGINLLRIVRPIVAGSLLFTGLTLALCQWVLPATMSVTNKIWHEQVHYRAPRGIDRNGRFFYKGEQGFYSFEQPKSDSHHYRNFSYAGWNEDYDLILLLTAKNAVWQQDEWFFTEGQLKKRLTGKDYAIELFDRTAFNLPEKPTDFFIPKYKYQEMSISQLFARAQLAGEQTGAQAWLDFHGRISYIFLGIPLLLLGLPMLILINEKWGRDISLAVPASCGLAFGAWIWWGAFQSMAKVSYLHPVPASWGIHFLVGGLGIFLLRRQNG